MVMFWLNVLMYRNLVEVFGHIHKERKGSLNAKGIQQVKNVSKHIQTLTGQWTAHLHSKMFPTRQNIGRKISSFIFSKRSFKICVKDDLHIKEPWDLVVTVICKVENLLTRQAIRNTWGSELSRRNGKLLFLVGRSNNESTNSLIVEESKTHGDIVQVNINEDYINLTLKSIAMLQWLTVYCRNSRFYLKADDDVYINIKRVMQEFKQTRKKRFFLCHVFKNSEVIRNQTSKYYVSNKEFSGEFYPTYCSGSAYGFPVIVLSDLYKSAVETKFFRMEDVFVTGILGEKNSIKYEHSRRFFVYKRDVDICDFQRASSSHRISVHQMYELFAQLKKKNITCKYVKV